MVVGSVLTLSVGGFAADPALMKINDWSHGVKLVLEDRLPPLKSNKKPLDVPRSTFVTTPGMWSKDSTGAFARLAYATSEGMRGAVTTPVTELTEYRHGADGLPALIRSARSA